VLNTAVLRLEQRLFRYSNSLPYISGDGFRHITEKFQRTSVSRISEMTLRDIHFIKSEDLELTLGFLSKSTRETVLLVGNSDQNFYSIPADIPSCVKRIYLQNSFISDQKLIRTLPIGVENRRHSMNGKPKFLRSTIPFSEKENAVLIGPFGNTHASRDALSRFRTSKNISVHTKRLNPKEFAMLAASFKFVACPRGNGVDTHRVWETLYRGSIPIVIDDEWSRSLDYLGLPILRVSDWGKEEVEACIERHSTSSISKPADDKFLWIDAWKDLLLKDLTDSC
jgi:hypothetical protein